MRRQRKLAPTEEPERTAPEADPLDATSVDKAPEQPMPIVLHEIILAEFSLRLKGVNPLLMERKSPKVIATIEITQQHGVNPEKGAPRDFDLEYEEAHYRLENGRLGFPAVAFKQACEDAAKRYTGGDIKGTVIAGGFFIVGPEFLPLEHGRVERTVELVKIPPRRGVLSPVHRPLVHDWSTVVTVRYNKGGAVSPEQIVRLFQLAGFHVGIGRKRPGLGHGYSNGTWEVVSE